MCLIFNNIEKEYLTVTRGRNRPAWAPVERDFITVQGMSGAHLSYSKRQIRTITVPVFILADSFSDLQKVKEDMAEWLIHEEPKKLVFKDEPDRTYYALVDGNLDLDELVRWGAGEITFVCPDPYKYGPEKTLTFPADIVKVENTGTAEADPIFEMTAKKKATFAMISNGDDENANYNLVGRPADIDEKLVDEKTTLVYERGESLSSWSKSGTQLDEGKVTDGELGTDGTGIHPLSYGSPGDYEGWYGPALMKEIDPIQDFEVEMRLRANTSRPDQLYRIEFYLYDENMNVLGKMAIRDYAITVDRYAAEGRVGEFKGGRKGYQISKDNYLRERSHFHGLVRMRRNGQKFELYVARLKTGVDEGKHHDILRVPFNDAANDYQGKLKHVQINILRHTDGPSGSVPRINALKVTKLSKATVDQTPYILYPEDVITFDHKDDDILINGEPRMNLKNFGGSFFKLSKGENMLVVTPEDTFDTKVTYRNKYL